MNQPARLFTVPQPVERRFQWGDVVVLLAVVVLLYAGISLAVYSPLALRGPDISIAPEVLPYYAVLSVGRMAAAYLLSLLVALLYGRAAAERRQAEHLLLLEILRVPRHQLEKDVLITALELDFPPEEAARQVEVVINWGRYAELLAYNDRTASIDLENHTAAEPPQS